MTSDIGNTKEQSEDPVKDVSSRESNWCHIRDDFGIWIKAFIFIP